MAKGNQDEGEGTDEQNTEITIYGAGLSALLSRSAASVIKVEGMLAKQLDNPRLKDDPEMVLRIYKQITDNNIALLTVTAQVMTASKNKEGVIQGLTTTVMSGVEGAVGISTGDPASRKNARVSRLIPG